MPEVNHEIIKCIGCGSCAALDPKHWVIKGDKAILKNSKPNNEGNYIVRIKEEDYGTLMESADSCPVECIKVKK